MRGNFRTNTRPSRSRTVIGIPLLVGVIMLASCSAEGEIDATASTASADQSGNESTDQTIGSELDGSAASDTTSPADPDTDSTEVTETTASTAPASTTAPPATLPAPSNSQSLMLFGYGAAGGWAGNRWFNGDWNDDSGSLVNWEGSEITVINIDGVQGTSTAVEAGMVCDPIGTYGISTQPELGYSDGYPEVGVIADWNPVPREWAVLQNPPEVYLEALQNFLDKRGIDPAGAVLDQVVRVDLEGDGVDEILISANDTWDFTVEPGPQSYSIVLLRKVIEGEVQTSVLFFETADPDQGYYFPRSRIAGFADLNGDAKLEILTQDDYYEGSAVIAWEYVNDNIGPVEILATGCGA